ncbi:hypothetical protein J0B02_10095 [Enterobacteriaceae bacterium YMB-R22]|uniref:hypothetical protein n=1 Tax=Tenebrionicola larvae TaxID=2815733 RepID=UPI002012F0AE|nr:hypothetical protein [Tenebrionicola larvae]MBV4413161.1 hypothetical protein [Tenebrionicola larvae]
MAKKEKTEFFLLCSKQAKINALIFPIFYCVSSILPATGWFVSSLSAANGGASQWQRSGLMPRFIRGVKVVGTRRSGQKKQSMDFRLFAIKRAKRRFFPLYG